MTKRCAIAIYAIALGAFSAVAPSLEGQQQGPNSMYSPSTFAGLRYRNVGPTRGGRVTTVAGVVQETGTFYMGASGGGVWKTTDYGQSWTPVSDGYFNTGSIGAIRVAPSNPNIVYVGTGSDGIRSNVITGRGIYKSTDAGRSWTHIGLTNTGQIGAVEIHPTNPNIVLVSAIGNAFTSNPDRGVYRTRDGGQTWEHVLFVSDSSGSADLEFAPDDPNTVYATIWRGERKPWTIISGAREGGMYKSTDGGTTWRHITNGLPQGLRGKGDLAVSPADPNRVYLLLEAPEDVGEGGLYRSDDRGESFRLISTESGLLDRPFYYLNVDADPTNADVVYVNSTGFYRSTDAGQSWQRRRTPHGDNHDIWINPNDPNIQVQSNDGGANVTRDGGETWSTQSNQSTAELYQVAIDDQFPYWLYAGQQDNSTIVVPSDEPYNHPGDDTGFWRATGGCETGPAIPKPGDHNIVYANCKGRFGRYSKLTGQEKQYYVGAANLYSVNPKDLKYRFQRVAPIYVSTHNPSVVYHGSQYLHRSRDEGVTWEIISPDLTEFDPSTQVISGDPITRDITGEEYFSTVYAVQESPIQEGLIWVGANDGPIHVTRDGGTTWNKVTPSGLPRFGRVQTVEPSPHRAGKAYVAVYRYLLGDFAPYIYKTENYGQSWTRLTDGTNGIPMDTPTRVIREDPAQEGLLYAGTEFGMYISFDDGEHWQTFQQNLPVTPITDIKVHQNDLVMSTMGRGFWIMDDITPLHELSQLVTAGTHLFQPSDAYRTRGGGFGGFGGAPSVPEFRPSGAMIDYYLPENAAEVVLEFYDRQGTLVRGFTSSAAAPQMVLPEPSMREFRLERVGGPRVPNTAGMHRFIWDMRHAGAWSQGGRGGRGGGSGPMVVPGEYEVRLIVAGETKRARFNLMMDPRVVADGVTEADIAEQVALALKVQDAVSQSRVAVATLEKLQGEFGDADGAAQREARAALEALAEVEKALTTADGRYQTPMIVDQLGYLNSMLNRADQKPGLDAYERYDELRIALEAQIQVLERFSRVF